MSPEDLKPGHAPETVSVEIKLVDFLARLTTEAGLHIRVPAGSSVTECIQRLGNPLCQALLDRKGRLQGEFAVILDSEFIPPQRIEQLRITKNSRLSIIPVAGGG